MAPRRLADFGPLKSGYDEFWGNRGGGVDYSTHKVGTNADLWVTATSASTGGLLYRLAGGSLDPFSRGTRGGRQALPAQPAFHRAALAGEATTREDRRSRRGWIRWRYGQLNIAHTTAAQCRRTPRWSCRLTEYRARYDPVWPISARAGTRGGLHQRHGGERFSDNWPFSGMKTEYSKAACGCRSL